MPRRSRVDPDDFGYSPDAGDDAIELQRLIETEYQKAKAVERKAYAPLSPDEEAEQAERTRDAEQDWLHSTRMTSTEVVLRIAIDLLNNGLVTGNVSVALRGAEVTRQNRPAYPVQEFLSNAGFAKHDAEHFDWRDFY